MEYSEIFKHFFITNARLLKLNQVAVKYKTNRQQLFETKKVNKKCCMNDREDEKKINTVTERT